MLLRFPLPALSDALASLLRTIVIALFLLTFVLQPFLIPSESMERTLLVGDFLLVNKQVFAPAGRSGSLFRHLLPYRDVERGDVAVFHFPEDPKRYLVKRVVGLPGDRLRIEDGHVQVNGVMLTEPYAAFEPAAANPLSFPPGTISCWATIAITATTRAPGVWFRGRRSSPGHWSFTSRCAGPPAPMCNRPRMIDSDTTGILRAAWQDLRAGIASSAWSGERPRETVERVLRDPMQQMKITGAAGPEGCL
jgi:signal peptidase I